jgi:hypothetical protein
MEKRGQTIQWQFLGLILAILAFIIVLILIFTLDFNSYTDEELCRLSVISRGSAPSTVGGLAPVKGRIPLKCTTEKICLSFSADDACSQYAGLDEDEITRVDLDKTKIQESADIIERITADAMYSCWSMMGEGKIDLFADNPETFGSTVLSNFYSTERKPTCVICSRVALSDEVKKSTDILALVDANDYMLKNGPQGSAKTYVSLYNQGANVGAYPGEFSSTFTKTDKTGETDEISFIFMQILTPEDAYKEALEKGATTGIVAGTFLLSPTTLAKEIVTGRFYTALGRLAIVGAAAGTSGLISYVNTKSNQRTAALHCTKFGGEGRYGCSVVQPMNYHNIRAINDLCAQIEGSP